VAKKYLKNLPSWECDYCESKADLQKNRNCDWTTPAECKTCGSVAFQDVYTEAGSSVFLCGKCNNRVKFPGEFMLGKTYRTPGCPKSQISNLALFLINLVHWSEETGKLPTASNLLDESLLYFEIRNFVINERAVVEEELTPKEGK